jgi:tetratricopeptide (TPR) repeat protein
MILAEFSDEELLQKGREAVRLQHYGRAREFLAEYCERFAKRGDGIPPGVLASYALAVGHSRSLKEGLDLCLKALASDRRNPHIYWSLAKLYILADSRKKAVDAVEIGLRLSPENTGLLKIRELLGVRQPPPIKFLPRSSAVNVRLGKAIRKLKATTSRRPGR